MAGARVTRGVAAGAAVERVGAGTADQRVVTAAALQQVGVRVANQRVVERRAFEVLDAVVAVAGSVAGVVGRRGQTRGQPDQRVSVAGGIDAGATDQRVGAGAAVQPVVAGTAVEAVVAGVAGQVVVEARADQAFDRQQQVAIGVTAGRGAGIQIDLYRSARVGVAGGVAAGAADQRVGARAADQRVVAGATVQAVATGIARQQVVGIGADQRLDAVQHVALGGAAVTGAVGQIDRDPGGRIAVVGGVEAGAADQRVGAAAPLEHVVAGAAVEQIGVGVAEQVIREGRAAEVLDLGQRVALGIAAAAGAGRQIDRDTGRRSAVGRGVVAAAADQHVGAAAAFQRVVAGTAVERVVAGIAEDDVVADPGRDLVVTGPGVDLVAQAVGREHDAGGAVAVGIADVGRTAHVLHAGRHHQVGGDRGVVHRALGRDGQLEGGRRERCIVDRDRVLDHDIDDIAAAREIDRQHEVPAIGRLRRTDRHEAVGQAAQRDRIDHQIDLAGNADLQHAREAGAQRGGVVADDDVVAGRAGDQLVRGLGRRRQIGRRCGRAPRAGDRRDAAGHGRGLSDQVVQARADRDGVGEDRRGRRGVARRWRRWRRVRRGRRQLQRQLHHDDVLGLLETGRGRAVGLDVGRRESGRVDRGMHRKGVRIAGVGGRVGLVGSLGAGVVRARLHRDGQRIGDQHLAGLVQQRAAVLRAVGEFDLERRIGHHPQRQAGQHMPAAVVQRQHEIDAGDAQLAHPALREVQDDRAADRRQRVDDQGV